MERFNLSMPHRTSSLPPTDERLPSSAATEAILPSGSHISPEENISPSQERGRQPPRPPQLSPLHAAVASLSPPRSSSLPSSLPAPQYIKQCQAVLDRQRHAFEEERNLWSLERDELNQRIAQLEEALRPFQSQLSSKVSSPPEKTVFNRNGGLWGSIGSNGSRQSSTSSMGEEVWRGGDPASKPARTFSEASVQSTKPSNRLPSIAENQKPGKHVSIRAEVENITSHSISGAAIDKNLDGITFKSSGVAPEIVKQVLSPPEDSLSPNSVPCPVPQAHPGANASSAPPILPGLAALRAADPYTLDAGHTPLAHAKYPYLDGNISLPDSDAQTPSASTVKQSENCQVLAEEQGNAAEVPAPVKQPSERQASYFPSIAEAEEPALEPGKAVLPAQDDPALTGPLGLTNEHAKDKQFLTALDDKLLQAAQDHLHRGRNDNGVSPPLKGAAPLLDGPSSNLEASAAVVTGPDTRADHAKSETNSESQAEEAKKKRESEPPLRLKRSLNFGSQLGSSALGRGM